MPRGGDLEFDDGASKFISLNSQHKFLLCALDLHTVWDGVSKDTHHNILNLLERSKKVVVYFSPARECRTLRQIADVIPLLEHCPKAAMEEFESMIDLAARIAQPQASLNLV